MAASVPDAGHLVTDRCDSHVGSNTMESDYFCTRKACVYNINKYILCEVCEDMRVAENNGSNAVTYKVYPTVLLRL